MRQWSQWIDLNGGTGINDRQHVWHDPSYPPQQVITEDRMRVPKLGKSPKRARTMFWVLLFVVVGGGLLTVMIVFGSAVVAGLYEGLSEPTMPSAVTLKEEEAVRGLATAIADRGKRGDFGAIVEMGDDSDKFDADELESDVSEAFSGFPIKDWAIDYENAQVLVDQQTAERIVMFRIVLIGQDGTQRVTNPFYAVDAGGQWGLTGIGGRDLAEDVY